ncbi:MAG: serine hydrolase [Gammaproteobacteria bacterium]|nr:serine hydrolase [Gammaproteobacteria bacterium]
MPKSLSILLIVLIAVGTFLGYQLWFDFGPWVELPHNDVPENERQIDDQYAAAGRTAMDAIREHRDKHGFPAITAAVAVAQSVVWSGAVCWADVDGRIPATQDTLMRIGSTSKAVTATALARLIDAGELSLDVPISKYSTNLPNDAWNPLTLRQLASHTAGLPDYERNGDRIGQLVTLCGCKHYTSVRDSLGIFDGSELLFTPGEDFSYTSFDVNLIGAIISAQQRKPFLSVLQERVFSPLGLRSSGGDHDGADRPDLAKFYETRGDKVRLWRNFDLSQRWPGGGLVSTSVELAMIGNAWLDPDFIATTTRMAMWTPQTLSNGDVNEQSYALGWRFNPDIAQSGDDDKVLSYAHHGGVSKGAMSWLVVYPDYGLSIAVNINTRAETFSLFAGVEKKIAAAFLEQIAQLKGTKEISSRAAIDRN